MQFIVSLPIKRGRAAWRVGSGLADQDDVRVGRNELPQLLHSVMCESLIAVVQMVLPRITAKTESKRIARPSHVLAQPVDGVKPKAVDPPIEPKSNDIPHRGPNGGILPVQVRLFLQK